VSTELSPELIRALAPIIAGTASSRAPHAVLRRSPKLTAVGAPVPQPSRATASPAPRPSRKTLLPVLPPIAAPTTLAAPVAGPLQHLLGYLLGR
jgi:hypothetical protein